MSADDVSVVLQQVEARWVEMTSVATVQRVLRPGATDQELDATAEALGHPLPAEARAFWQWHNGFVDRSDWGALPFGPFMFSLEEVVTETLTMLPVVAETPTTYPAGLPMPDWSRAIEWGSSFGAGLFYFFPDGEYCRVGEVGDGVFTPLTDTIAEAFSVVLAGLNRKGWSHDGNRWQRPFNELTRFERLSGLV